MRAKRLLLCIVMSVALVVTFIPMTPNVENAHAHSWWEDIMDTAVDIEVNQEKTVTISGDEEEPEALFKFQPQEAGTYVFYSTHEEAYADPAGLIFDLYGTQFNVDEDIAFPENRNFCVYFNVQDVQVQDGKVYYLHAFGDDETTEFTVGVKKSDVKSISFEPASPHYSYGDCTLDFEEWELSTEFEAGDQITVTKIDNSSKTYVYRKDAKLIYDGHEFFVDRFVNVNQESDVLAGNTQITPWSPDYQYRWSAPLSENAPGSVKQVPIIVYHAQVPAITSMDVKLATRHRWLKKQSAVPATCTEDGNIEYWYCKYCGQKFSNNDEDNLIELSGNSWKIPAAGHKWETVTKEGAGLLKNGTSCDRCAACGTEQNLAVIPGWSASYAKSVKVAKSKGSITIKWAKQSGTNQKKFNGYQIRYATKSDMSNAKYKTAGKSAKSKKIGKLKKKTKYFVQVRTYTKKGGVTYYSKWSGKKTVKTK